MPVMSWKLFLCDLSKFGNHQLSHQIAIYEDICTDIELCNILHWPYWYMRLLEIYIQNIISQVPLANTTISMPSTEPHT